MTHLRLSLGLLCTAFLLATACVQHESERRPVRLLDASSGNAIDRALVLPIRAEYFGFLNSDGPLGEPVYHFGQPVIVADGQQFQRPAFQILALWWFVTPPVQGWGSRSETFAYLFIAPGYAPGTSSLSAYQPPGGEQVADIVRLQPSSRPAEELEFTRAMLGKPALTADDVKRWPAFNDSFEMRQAQPAVIQIPYSAADRMLVNDFLSGAH